MLASLSRRELQRRLAKLPLAQAPSPFRFHAQMLRVLVLGQVAHCLMHLAANVGISLIDQPNAEIIPITLLVSVTAVVVTLITGNALPQLTYLSGLVDVATHLRPIEEKRRVDLVAPLLPLLNAVDMPNQMIKDLVALNLPTQLIQIRKYVFHTLPVLKHRQVMEVQPNHDS